MRKIYSAATLPDAHLVKGLLAQAGIETKVFNENAQGGMGEIPFTHAYPEVWLVDERDSDLAQEVIRQFEMPGAPVAVVRCHACGEDNPGNFQVCWSCGESL